jgi:uncharacterized protein with FMN-binding domain
MNKKLVAPLALLASVSLLTSCTKKPEPVPALPPVEQNIPAPVMQDVPPTPVTPVESTGTTESPQAVAPTVLTRTELITYKSPAADQDPVEFSLTVTDGVITAASAIAKSENDISQKLQTAFAAEVAAKVVGKKAKDLDVDAIGGASLTTAAFEMFAHSF